PAGSQPMNDGTTTRGATAGSAAPSAAPGDETPAAYRARYREIESRLEAAATSQDRERVKREIIGLFKGVDASLAELGQIKEEIRLLVDRYKQAMAAAAPAQAPQFTGARPAVHEDHIGASTFIEKGWSLISLGDYPGAIQALTRAIELSPGAIQAQSLLGWAQMLNEQYDEALATFSRVLMSEPA